MVTRVDKKPIIYNTTLLRVWRPAVVDAKRKLLDELIEKSAGHATPKARVSDILDDFEDVEVAFKMFGIDDPIGEVYELMDDRESDDCIRMARTMLDRTKSRVGQIRNSNLMEEVAKAQVELLSDVERIYYGTEAVYQLWNRVLNDGVFEHSFNVKYHNWCLESAKRIMILQAPYMFIHPSAVHDCAVDMIKNWSYKVWAMWHKFKKTETMLIRIFSRKNVFAHNYHSGGARSTFEPSERRLDDFDLPVTGYAQVQDHVRVFHMMGVKYVKIGSIVCALSPDDCQNASMMAQAHFRTAMYFMPSNQYNESSLDRAIGLLKDMTAHCCRRIDMGLNYSDFIRSLHIMAQRDFNDIWEVDHGEELGWKERSDNYVVECKALDDAGEIFHKRIMELAVSDADKLNVGFFYHAFVGDEMLIDDLKKKVVMMPDKVMPADKETWDDFIRFCKAYLLCRNMSVYKRKPKAAGDLSMMNSKWAENCVNGKFSMPPREDWGKVWVSGEFTWTNFADIWHLEAQDVAYVAKDSKGLLRGDYRGRRMYASELLMAMTAGDVLDPITGSTPTSARARVREREPVSEVVLTTAPKAENAKPSWKKRVTFAADCEFRKLQAEYDRNCRKVMAFVRGPSLAVDQHILETQFMNIAEATVLGTDGAICSHDISAWSESMDRARKFEFEGVLIEMMSEPDMINIKDDWAKIKATVLKQGAKELIALDNGSFQGFDGSASTILHSMILIYCMETARRDIGMSKEVKTDMATLIDDCVALMRGLDNQEDAKRFWVHLKSTYLKLGFEVDELKSIFSTIKAIYLSRRFLKGAEVPSDFKIFVKAHCSYEDPLRCATDIVSDIFGATRGACDANGDVWFIYFTTLVSSLAELAHQVPKITTIDANATAVIAIAPSIENGWNIPSLVDWTTNDIMDKRTHFNAILEAAAMHDCASIPFKRGIDVMPKSALRMVHAIKCQAWRIVSFSNIFTNPFEAIREGPLKPDMLRRNAVSDLMSEVISAEPWVSLMAWSNSETTNRVRQILIDSGCLHAPTLAALVNCMPDNYRLGMVGKAVGSSSLLSTLPRGMKIVLKRRVQKCAINFFEFGVSLFNSSHEFLTSSDFCTLNHVLRTMTERDQFYALNGVDMIDHTFPDPVGSFTHSADFTGSAIGPNLSGVRIWDRSIKRPCKLNEYVSNSRLFVPPRSGRVWEVTSEFARGWDSVSQRISMGLAIIARASADGHGTAGILSYFTKAWNEYSDITPNDTQLIAIHGSIKRLDSNPGSSNHPITINRNILSGLEVKLETALNSLPTKAQEISGVPSHLHDVLAHRTAMRAVTCSILSLFVTLGCADMSHRYSIALRPDCVVAASTRVMTTDEVAQRIDFEILDGADNYGLLQASPSLAHTIVIPTMRTGWVEMINALMSGNHAECNELMAKVRSTDVDTIMNEMVEKEVFYTSNVVTAKEPAKRQRIESERYTRFAIIPERESGRAAGDNYTMSVRGIGSRFSRALSKEQPEHIVAAIAIKSIVWDRLKGNDLGELAKIFYEDPDANYKMLEYCGSTDFWKAIIHDVVRCRKKKPLSELMVMGLRSLSINEIRINVTNDPKVVLQSVASFFGANIKCVTKILENELMSVAGRSSWQFDAPIVQRVITNNPALMNIKLRKEHMGKLLDHNIRQYTKRIEDLENALSPDEVSHRGDKQQFEHNKVGRLAELRNRRAVYKHTKLNEEGAAVIDEVGIMRYLIIAAKGVAEKHKYEVELPDETELDDDDEIVLNLDECMIFSINVGQQFDEEKKRVKKSHGWHAGQGNIGLRYAYDTIMSDSACVNKTQFAVSASEIAPFIHRHVKSVAAGEPAVRVDAPIDSDIDWGDEETPGMVSFKDMISKDVDIFSGGGRALQIPAAHALFTAIVTGAYDPYDVNRRLGTTLPRAVDISDVRAAGIASLSDDAVHSRFPTLLADYFNCGAIFNEEWLTAGGSDAYTVDELGKGANGWLF